MTRIMRRWEWALPSPDIDLEVLQSVPADWQDTPADERKPPLLFVHGICSGAWAYADWLTAASDRGYYAAAVSFRGHGDSGGYDRLKVTTMRDYAHDVLQAITTLPSPPVLVAHSMGALVARDVADRYPLRGMALLCPAPAHGAWRSGWQRLRTSPWQLAKSVVTARTPDDPDLLFASLPTNEGREIISRMGPESPLVMTSLLRPRRFAPPKCPVAVFGAKDDRLIGAKDVAHTANQLRVGLRWWPDTGHEAMLDGTESACVGRLLDWVDQAIPAGTPALPGQADGPVTES